MLPSLAEPGPPLETDGGQFSTLLVAPSHCHQPFKIGFEDAMQNLSLLQRLFIEPDGSFVWVNDRHELSTWQLDGHLYDRHDRLLYVELKGRCPAPAFEQVCAAVGLTPSGFMAQLLQQAVFLAPAEFMRWAFPSETSKNESGT